MNADDTVLRMMKWFLKQKPERQAAAFKELAEFAVESEWIGMWDSPDEMLDDWVATFIFDNEREPTKKEKRKALIGFQSPYYRTCGYQLGKSE